MNHPSPELDQFEATLLADLRTHVAERSAPRRLPVGRLLAGAAAAALVSGAVVVTGLGGRATTSPAYAVEREADGDVLVTVERLEHAAGLQSALREAGIDADVSFPTSTDGLFPSPFMPVDPDVEDDPQTLVVLENEGPCLRDTDPATLTTNDAGFELRIPAGSPAQERPVTILTTSFEVVWMAYPGDAPLTKCVVRVVP